MNAKPDGETSKRDFTSEEFLHVASLMEDGTNVREIMSNNFNVILAALRKAALATDFAAWGLAYLETARCECDDRMASDKACLRCHMVEITKKAGLDTAF